MNVGKGKGSMGLSYPMLTKTNYTVWSMKMKVLMQAHGVWEAVEQSDPKAVVVDERVDKVAMAMIYQSVPEEILLSLSEKKQAKEVWEALKTMCQGANRAKVAKIQTLKAEFEALTMKDTELLDDFSLKLVGLVTNIRVLGEEVKEDYVVKKLLRAVPSKFLQIASTIEQFGNLEEMMLEEAIGSLKAHEERLKGTTEVTDSQVLLTEEEWRKRENSDSKLLLTREEWQKRMNRGGNEGGSNTGGRNGRDKSRIRCYNCHIYGHYAAECRKPKREKEARQEALMARTEEEEPALLLAKHDKKCEESKQSYDGGQREVHGIERRNHRVSEVW
ncbi:CCHC-type domain-containing protein [Heracleum sosnowskyi]|uniref:CCHC-type domain-containing protein n=1 Tax=Heracleum sosnowskyi TaxID=360622 RepID=A0AAD8JAJ2_9APIA|nr:CCHC-type domain-containing protein [Heracleum sosnowskyi]